MNICPMNYVMILVLVALVSFAIAGKSMAPWVPTRSKDIQRLLELLHMSPGEKFLEIGSGDGRVSLAVARTFTRAHITWGELAFPMFCIARLRVYLSWLSNIHISFGDAFRYDFWSFQHIYVYGMPKAMQQKIVPKFMREAQPWTKLYSYVFSIPKEYQKCVRSYGLEQEAKIHILEKI